jgi:hypothetical protein
MAIRTKSGLNSWGCRFSARVLQIMTYFDLIIIVGVALCAGGICAKRLIKDQIVAFRAAYYGGKVKKSKGLTREESGSHLLWD